MTALDIRANRRTRHYSGREYLGRALWTLCTPLFRWSPRPCFGWRRFLLRLFGARIGQGVHVYPSARIYLPWNLSLGDDSSIGEWALIYNLGPISIAERATISHKAHLCAGTHDYRNTLLPLIRAPIEIGAQAWVCAEAFIGPRVQVGEGAIVGAVAVVTRDVPAWTIVVGNPAFPIGTRTLYSEKTAA